MISRDEWVERARECSLERACEVVGLKLPRNGELQAACPVCGGRDRFSVSPKKGVWNCRGSEGGNDAIGLVMHAAGTDFIGACEILTGEPPPRGDSHRRELDPEIERERRYERRDAEIARAKEEAVEARRAANEAAELFAETRAIAETCVEDYLDNRGVLITSEPELYSDLRFIPSLAYFGFADHDSSEQGELGKYHCMVSAVRDVTGEIQGCHRTYIDPAGSKLKSPGDRTRNKAKKGFKRIGGGLIRLGPIGELLALSEGIETGLSWYRLARAGHFGDEWVAPSIACAISLGNLCGGATGSIPHPSIKNRTIPNCEPNPDSPGALVPASVKRLILIGDGDSDAASTCANLLTAAERHRRAGREVFVCLSPDGTDFNDVLLSNGAIEAPPIWTFEEFQKHARTAMAPPPYQSHFRAVKWSELDLPGPEHEWLVKNVLTRGERAMMVGASQSGKSFLALDLALAIAQGKEWFGNRTLRGGVVYQAGEGGRGIKKRLRAYRKENDIKPDDELPFVLLPATVDLYASDDQTNKLISEIKHWGSTFDGPLELVVIDTLSAATPGADENSSKDIGPVLARCERIAQECNCAVMLVHHMNAGGQKPRGHTSILANLDSVLTVTKTEDEDVDRRIIREIETAKMKDGEAGKKWRFVLPAVEIGVDADDDKITSCVVRLPNVEGEPGETGKPIDAGLRLTPPTELFLRAVHRAVADHGETAPYSLNVESGSRVVQWKRVVESFAGMTFVGTDEPDESKRAKMIAAEMKKQGEKLISMRVIMRETPYVWLAGRKVRGFSNNPGGATARRDDPPPSRGSLNDYAGQEVAF